MIEKDIREFAKQFTYEPEVQNADKLGDFETVVIGGMGGSGLIAGILRAIKPELDIAAHHEYGLPKFVDRDTEKRLFIAVSHSGNTEETLDFYKSAEERGFQTAAIASSGKLLEIAKEKELPYIDLPGDDVEPRMTLGYMLRAILKLLGEEKLYKETGKLADVLKPEDYEKQGKDLAEKLFNKTPIIYASRSNQIIAYNWKIKLNETGKMPAFYNTFPELNHNEMQGFDVKDANKNLSKDVHFIFLKDVDDHPRIKIRMETTAKMYEERGLSVEQIEIEGKNRLEKIFNALSLGDWFAFYVARKYDLEPEPVPMVEEFKNKI
ncbi:bifunctional phosphoglucose/phosphomannose isomerase [Patescibacteria group bacterium]|nr:bifunctional phosphoglucose/phosphomannose isomerase [Patescibacteria group bacterium]